MPELQRGPLRQPPMLHPEFPIGTNGIGNESLPALGTNLPIYKPLEWIAARKAEQVLVLLQFPDDLSADVSRPTGNECERNQPQEKEGREVFDAVSMKKPKGQASQHGSAEDNVSKPDNPSAPPKVFRHP